MSLSEVRDDPSLGPPGWHKRLFAWFMHACSPKADHRFRKVKGRLFSELHLPQVADVVEVGLGTGPNFKYYADRVQSIVGVDFNAAMQPYALESAAQAKVQPGKLQLVVGRAEALPLPDACADAVIATHLMCSVADVPVALREIRRVLRPGGKYVFLEHVAAPPHRTHLYSLQRWLTPLSVTVADGCHMDRDTLAAIEAAGFSRVDAEQLEPDLPWPARLFAPHVAGVAVN